MFCINLFQPFPNALVLICHKKKKKKEEKESLGARQKRPLTTAPVQEGLQGVCKQINTRTRHLSLRRLTFVLRLRYEPFAIGASDKSAFCKRQLSIYNMPSIQKEKSSDALLQGKAQAPVNTVSDWASLSKGRVLVPGRVHWTLLSPAEHAWHWVAEDGSAAANDRDTVFQKVPAEPLPSRFLVTRPELAEVRALHGTALPGATS